ncbi:MAG: hypothetical protein ACJ780_23635 [Solirubrobacteraceae bacterium]
MAADVLAQFGQALEAWRSLDWFGPAGGVLLGNWADGGAVGGEDRVVLVSCGGQLCDREVLVVANEHPSGDSRHHRRPALIGLCVVGRVFGPVGLVAIGVGDQKTGGASRARQGAVAPTGGQVRRRRDDDRPLNGAALHAMAGEAVGVLDVVSDVARRQLSFHAAIGLSTTFPLSTCRTVPRVPLSTPTSASL